ncbi:MAG: hypothetical protein RMA76_38230 [Deltaproteobacteria bacterium]|jgi:hypothetical protein
MTAQPQAIARRSTVALDPYAFEPGSLAELKELGREIVQSGIFPHIKTPEQAVVVAMWGRSLGLSAVQAFEGLYTVNGRPAWYTWLLVSLVRQHPECEFFECVESTPTRAVWRSKRKGRPEIAKTFTIQDAHDAGYAQRNAKYKTEPEIMLSNRCASRLARQEWSEQIHGMATGEDILDGEVDVVSVTVVDDGAKDNDAKLAQAVVESLEEAPPDDTPTPVEEPEEGAVTTPEQPDAGDPHVELVEIQVAMIEALADVTEGDTDAARAMAKKAWSANLADTSKMSPSQAEASISKARTLLKKCELGQAIARCAADMREMGVKAPPFPKGWEQGPWTFTIKQLEGTLGGFERRASEGKSA